MCKFNNRLFVYIMFVNLMGFVYGAPRGKSFLDNYYDDSEADMYYDQRQNGTANVRVNFDGFLIAIPSSLGDPVESVLNALESDIMYGVQSAIDNSGENSSDDAADLLNNTFNLEDIKPLSSPIENADIAKKTITSLSSLGSITGSDQISEKSSEPKIKKNPHTPPKPSKRNRSRFRLSNLLKLFRGNSILNRKAQDKTE